MADLFEQLSDTDKEDVQQIVDEWVKELMLINPETNDETTQVQLMRALREGAAKKMKKEGWL